MPHACVESAIIKSWYHAIKVLETLSADDTTISINSADDLSSLCHIRLAGISAATSVLSCSTQREWHAVLLESIPRLGCGWC